MIQYIFIGYIGHLEEQSLVSVGHTWLFLAVEANQIKQIVVHCNGIRKIVRFIRVPILFSSLKNRKMNLKFEGILSKLNSLFLVSIFVSDFSDLLFYCVDHYSFLTLLGITGNKVISSNFEDLGNYLWVIGAGAQIISILAKSVRMKIEGYCLGQNKNREAYWLVGDLLGAVIELFVGLTFINPRLASKKVFATFILIGCAYKLTKSVMI